MLHKQSLNRPFMTRQLHRDELQLEFKRFKSLLILIWKEYYLSLEATKLLSASLNNQDK